VKKQRPWDSYVLSIKNSLRATEYSGISHKNGGKMEHKSKILPKLKF
jgi:hypothetical protein